MNNGKETSPMTLELTAIKKVAKALEGLTPDQKRRVMMYVNGAVHEEWNAQLPSRSIMGNIGGVIDNLAAAQQRPPMPSQLVGGLTRP